MRKKMPPRSDDFPKDSVPGSSAFRVSTYLFPAEVVELLSFPARFFLQLRPRWTVSSLPMFVLYILVPKR